VRQRNKERGENGEIERDEREGNSSVATGGAIGHLHPPSLDCQALDRMEF